MCIILPKSTFYPVFPQSQGADSLQFGSGSCKSNLAKIKSITSTLYG